MLPPEQAAAAFVERELPDTARDLRLVSRPRLLSALAALVAAERAAVREACAADVERRGRRREDCPPGCLCADPAHLAAAIRALPLE